MDKTLFERHMEAARVGENASIIETIIRGLLATDPGFQRQARTTSEEVLSTLAAIEETVPEDKQNDERTGALMGLYATAFIHAYQVAMYEKHEEEALMRAASRQKDKHSEDI